MHELVKAAPLQRDWSDRFALDFAMTLEGSGSTPTELLKEYGFEPEDLEVFSKQPLFLQKVDHYRKSLQEHGFTFKMKAQAQADLLLDTSWDVIHTSDVSPAVKADLIKWTAKMAGYEPANTKEGVGNAVQININMGDPALAAPAGIRTIENG